MKLILKLSEHSDLPKTPKVSGEIWLGAVIRIGDILFSFLPFWQFRVRADAGFGYGPVLDMLEVRPTTQYAVLSRMVPSLKGELGGLRYEEIAEFEHRPHGWPHATSSNTSIQ